MIKSMKLKLSGGEFDIRRDVDFSVTSDSLAHLVYEKNGIWFVESDPCRGKYAKTVITLPYQHSFSDIVIEMTDGTLNICEINCDNIELTLKESALGADMISTLNLYINSANSDVCIRANSQLTSIDCGFGTVNLSLTPYKYGYKIHSECGMGNVTLNSVLLPKKHISEMGKRRIDIICGMGDVNINT